MGDNDTITAINPVDTQPDFPRYRLSIPGVATYLAKGYPQTRIARIFNVSPQAVNQFINSHAEELDCIRDFDDIIKSVLKHKTGEIVSSIDARDIKKASLQQKVTSAAIAIEKIRLLEGKSTQNIAHAAIQGKLNEIEAQIEALEND